ncbi:MAG: type II toxin-antitoxin system RelE/ParE family toxin [Saprospiraceae bacterium]|nr:type II toxin-antitoxin system RelE/ParE family toxin [Pyrinomonadaceae bacterium]
MIKSFADKETEKIFNREFSRKLPNDIQRIARRKLETLDASENLSDLRIPPSNRLEKLNGERSHQHSIRINDQWRICFEWRDESAHDVEIIDYH